MTENKDELQRFYDAGNQKVAADKAKLLSEIEEVRLRLEAVAVGFADDYQKSWEESARGIEDSYQGTIQPFWKKLVSTGAQNRIVAAGYEGRTAQITDITNYDWPELAKRALEKGGIYPDRLQWDGTLKWLNPEVRPCLVDAWAVLNPHSSLKPSSKYEELTVKCYRGDGRGLVGLSQSGLSIHRLWDVDSRAYHYQGRRYYFNPAEDFLPPLPEYIHPRLVNEFAEQLRNGKCDEYIGRLLVWAEKKSK